MSSQEGSETEKPEHVEAEQVTRAEPSENPLARVLNVTVSLPETLEIKVVDASALAEYEVWSLISSILSGAVIGFFVAFLQAAGPAFGYMALVLAIVFAVALWMTFKNRRRLTRKSKDIRLRATEIISEK